MSMETLWLDLKYAVRMFSRNPGFVFVSVVTLSLGIGLNTAVFGILNAVLFRSLPYHDPERLVHIDELGERGGIGVSPPNFLDFRQQNRSLEQVAAFTGGSFVLTGSKEPLRVEGLNASYNLFSLLGVSPLVGRAFLPEEEGPGRNQVAVMSHRLWT